jgi:hypothetical protein
VAPVVAGKDGADHLTVEHDMGYLDVAGKQKRRR